jgi:hypothetical protein
MIIYIINFESLFEVTKHIAPPVLAPAKHANFASKSGIGVFFSLFLKIDKAYNGFVRNT